MDFLKHPFVRGVVLKNRYETISPLNHGSFGMVIMARDRSSGRLVALKCLAKPSATNDKSSQFNVDERSEEVQIHSRLGYHPNIVNLLNSFETETNIYLVLEYCSMGDLYEAIRQGKGPKETEHVREFMLQLVHAVDYLHQQGIYHRDIKPENIFLTETGKMKLGDFGLATSDTWSYEAAVGSDRYMAPEQYDPAGNGLSPGKADIWSIGICLLNILFSRNPFGVPAASDPLFSDFVRDRQSLFDVFPNMSQDTYEVLVHSLAIDPEKRSLSLVKEALDRVVSFTIDDETLDEFCTENRDVVTATANREPLRTPSITSPTADNGESFPWTKALHLTNPKGRQLSVIPDTEADMETGSEDLFPGSELSTHDWFSKADTRSIDSTVDSGLGLSIGSTNIGSSGSSALRSRPLPIASSLPAIGGRAGSALASIFKKKGFESKSWSDLWEEDEEERQDLEQRVRRQPDRRIIHLQAAKPTTLSQIDSSDDGRSTPRACLAELKNPSSKARSSSNDSKDSLGSDERISEHTGFIFDDSSSSALVGTRPNLPSRPSRRSLLEKIDKWSALGERRRAGPDNSTAPPKDIKPATSATDPRRRFSSTNWRRSFAKGLTRPQSVDVSVLQQKEWSMSQDWRKSSQNLSGSPMRPHASQLDGGGDSDVAVESEDEWLGDWKELHL